MVRYSFLLNHFSYVITLQILVHIVSGMKKYKNFTLCIDFSMMFRYNTRKNIYKTQHNAKIDNKNEQKMQRKRCTMKEA